IELKNIGKHPKSHTPIFEEYRVFYIGNKPLVVIDYWNNRKINLSTEDKKVIMDAPKEVKAKFYTIDFARKSNGKLVIMEMGDGQVSGLQGFDEQKFYDLLWENLPESRA
ncbi:ATP-grasp domain-containing protein, partial [Ligilactobacillus salivarius]